MKTPARLQAAAYALNAMLEKDSDAINKLFALKVVASNALCLCMPTMRSTARTTLRLR